MLPYASCHYFSTVGSINMFAEYYIIVNSSLQSDGLLDNQVWRMSLGLYILLPPLCRCQAWTTRRCWRSSLSLTAREVCPTPTTRTSRGHPSSSPWVRSSYRAWRRLSLGSIWRLHTPTKARFWALTTKSKQNHVRWDRINPGQCYFFCGDATRILWKKRGNQSVFI